jgi:small-conductance mechanosensitive channel
MVVIDIPIGFVSSEEAVAVLKAAAETVAHDPEHETGFLEPPDVVGVEQLTVDGAVIRTIAKTTADSQIAIQRDMRRVLTEALEATGMSERIAASRLPRSAVPPAWLGGPESPPPPAAGQPGGTA